jgi:L-serine dehydratase
VISTLDLFTIGVGPSSSHTVGPMRAMAHFSDRLRRTGGLKRVDRVTVELFGSLGSTGRGHGTGPAVLAGLAGYTPEAIDPDELRLAYRLSDDTIELDIFDVSVRVTVQFRGDVVLGGHSNSLRSTATDGSGSVVDQATYASIGGGSVVDECGHPLVGAPTRPPAHPFVTADDLLRVCDETGLSIGEVVLANERSWRADVDTDAGLDSIAAAMRQTNERGANTLGVLPGGLNVGRRAPSLIANISRRVESALDLTSLDWVTAWAIAVNEENAAGNRVVTAPTNGAAGIVPAVLEYYRRFLPTATDSGVRRFLLTAAAFGFIVKSGASVSGADVGCQGEVGSACAMAAAGLAAVQGGTSRQIENAAEIGMEHNLGLTCDPIGGLVQIPCIERNAIGAVKAIAAARIALAGDGRHHVSFDQVVATMRETGADMHHKYKETSLGGLAVHVVEC